MPPETKATQNNEALLRHTLEDGREFTASSRTEAIARCPFLSKLTVEQADVMLELLATPGPSDAVENQAASDEVPKSHHMTKKGEYPQKTQEKASDETDKQIESGYNPVETTREATNDTELDKSIQEVANFIEGQLDVVEKLESEQATQAAASTPESAVEKPKIDPAIIDNYKALQQQAEQLISQQAETVQPAELSEPMVEHPEDKPEPYIVESTAEETPLSPQPNTEIPRGKLDEQYAEESTKNINQAFEAPAIHELPVDSSEVVIELPRSEADETLPAVEQAHALEQLEDDQVFAEEADKVSIAETEPEQVEFAAELLELFAESEAAQTELRSILPDLEQVRIEAAESPDLDKDTAEAEPVKDELFTPYLANLREIENTKPVLRETIDHLRETIATINQQTDMPELAEEAIKDIITILQQLGCEEPHKVLADYAKSHSLAELLETISEELPELNKLIDYQQHLLAALARASSRSDRRLIAAQNLLRLLGGHRLAVAAA